jgi:hypothetical protein
VLLCRSGRGQHRGGEAEEAKGGLALGSSRRGQGWAGTEEVVACSGRRVEERPGAGHRREGGGMRRPALGRRRPVTGCVGAEEAGDGRRWGGGGRLQEAALEAGCRRRRRRPVAGGGRGWLQEAAAVLASEGESCTRESVWGGGK